MPSNNTLFYYIDPIAYPDSGFWHTLGFMSNYYCNQSSNNIIDCLTNSSYYLNSNYHHYYCDSNQDTVSLQCYFNTGELVIYLMYYLMCVLTLLRKIHTKSIFAKFSKLIVRFNMLFLLVLLIVKILITGNVILDVTLIF